MKKEYSYILISSINKPVTIILYIYQSVLHPPRKAS